MIPGMESGTFSTWTGTTTVDGTSVTYDLVFSLEKDDPPDIAVPAHVPTPAPNLPGAAALELPVG